jgi:exonuclease III
VRAPSKDKCDNKKKKFYDELERAFDQFPKHHTKILLGEVNAKMEREDIFKPTTVTGSLHETDYDNGDKVVNFATSKNIVV